MMVERLMVVILAMMWFGALGLIAGCIYLRVFLIGDDAFDPLLDVSVEMLWGAAGLFLCCGLLCRFAMKGR